MEMVILICSVLLFVIIFSSVRLAIKPLINKQNDSNVCDNKEGLTKLRDIGVFSNQELKEVVVLYQKMGKKKQYDKYEKVLIDLKEMGYLTDEQYITKLNNLKNYYRFV